MKSPDFARLIEQDLQDVKTLNVGGTPESFMNGRPLPSFGSEQLKNLVEEELAKSGKYNTPIPWH